MIAFIKVLTLSVCALATIALTFAWSERNDSDDDDDFPQHPALAAP